MVGHVSIGDREYAAPEYGCIDTIGLGSCGEVDNGAEGAHHGKVS